MRLKGKRVECSCAPKCARSWPDGHGPCFRGVVLRTRRIKDAELLVRQEHGAFSYLVDIGHGQRARRTYAGEVWVSRQYARVLPSEGAGK